MDMEIDPAVEENTAQTSQSERIGVPNRVLGFLSRHSTFFSRWSEVNLACACSTACVSCVSVAAGSLIVPIVAESRQARAESSGLDEAP